MALPRALAAQRLASGVPPLAPPQSLQLALYDGDGSYYARHVDNPGRDAPGASDGPPGLRTGDRALTAILYFNAGWLPAHGGALRLWPPTSAADSAGAAAAAPAEEEQAFVDVAPVAGRLLLFDASAVEHEVRPSHAARWALSAWMPRADACV
jgi:SM-20-related protein